MNVYARRYRFERNHGNKADCSNLAYPMLVLSHLPNGNFLVRIDMDV